MNEFPKTGFFRNDLPQINQCSAQHTALYKSVQPPLFASYFASNEPAFLLLWY